MKKILIIEDDPIVGHIYRSRLEKEGFEVELAADGQTGFYAIHRMEPDGLLLDLMLPKMNGVEILRKIRAQSKFRNLPVIVFTNAYVASMIQDAFLAGATAVYNKSTLTPRQIVDALNEYVCGKAPDSASPDEASVPGASAAPAAVGLAQAGLAPIRPSTPDTALKTPVSMALFSGGDEDSQAHLGQTFFSQVPEHLAALRKPFQELSKVQGEAARQGPLGELYRRVHSLTSKAGIAGLRPISQLTSALEALVKELIEKPSNATPSTLRTMANAVDLLGELCVPGIKSDLADAPPISILVVDDDLLTRRAMTFALQQSFSKPEGVETPEAALALAEQRPFDVIFMDVVMPGMNGFGLCEKVRATSANKTTPVIFVTSTADFSSRVQSTLCGGNDLIAKPFLFIEITVKALTFVLRSRLQKLKASKN